VTRRITKDKRKGRGTVDKPSLEQHFSIYMYICQLLLLHENFGTVALALPALVAGWLAGKQMKINSAKFRIICTYILD